MSAYFLYETLSGNGNEFWKNKRIPSIIQLYALLRKTREGHSLTKVSKFIHESFDPLRSSLSEFKKKEKTEK